jgi:hypothetical protein
MAERIQIVVDRAEKEWYRRLAAREGKTLSEWLRAAARERAARALARPAPDAVARLEAFFEACDEHERGREPDWEAHRDAIERSIASGGSAP